VTELTRRSLVRATAWRSLAATAAFMGCSKRLWATFIGANVITGAWECYSKTRTRSSTEQAARSAARLLEPSPARARGSFWSVTPGHLYIHWSRKSRPLAELPRRHKSTPSTRKGSRNTLAPLPIKRETFLQRHFDPSCAWEGADRSVSRRAVAELTERYASVHSK
jgi:hypothetical protein